MNTMRNTLPAMSLAALLLGACTATRLAQADKAFDRMAYAKAAEKYENALVNARAADLHQHRAALLRAADAHRRNHDHARAKLRYQLAATMGGLTAEENQRYGEVLLALGDRGGAAQRFTEVLLSNPENHAAQDLLASCGAIDGFYADTLHYAVSELPMTGVSSAFCAVPYADGIVIAADKPAGLDKSNPWNGRGFLDLYFVRKHTAVTWDPPTPLAGEVNGPYHEGPAVFSADGRTMFFTRSNYMKVKLLKDEGDVSHLKLFRATRDANGRWSDLHAFGHNGEDFSTGHPALSADGRTLYFASDRPGGIGGSDIWRSVNNGDGWGAPENLGPTVNTPGDELFPGVAGDALYFSSTAHRNMGGLDIFMTVNENGDWSEPRNLGYPVNTSRDDFAFTLSADAKTGYLSSDRTGIDRVFQFFVRQPLFWLEGNVFSDLDNAYLPMAEVTLTNLDTDEDSTMTTGEDGHFKFRLMPNTDYHLEVAAKGMLTEARDISTKGLAAGKTMQQDFLLRSALVNSTFTLKNIYFDYDKWDIRPDAATELDKLLAVIKANPRLTFELGAHTDSRGGDLYNLVLSDARAHSAEDYLIRSGVDPTRISSKGFGEEVLVNSCADGVNCSEEQHQANRRVEVRITSVKELAQQ